MTTLGGGPQPVSVARIAGQVLAEMAECKRHMTGLVLQNKVRHLSGHRVRRPSLQERQQRQERTLTEHRQQERRGRPVRLLRQLGNDARPPAPDKPSGRPGREPRRVNTST